MFKELSYNSELFKKIITKYINHDDFYRILYIIQKPYISISGSSILQLITNNLYKHSDLDIYIDISYLKVNRNEIENIFILIYQLIELNHYKFLNKQLNINRCFTQILDVINYSVINLENNHYTSLSKYLKLYLSFINDHDRKIELIFISTSIDTVIENTFDYDIIKNYWSNGKLYASNEYGINNKIATMKLEHFNDRVLSNKREFNNFIRRYIKYTHRNYKIYIHKTHITKTIFSSIVNIYHKKQINNATEEFSIWEYILIILYTIIHLISFTIVNPKLYYTLEIEQLNRSEKKMLINKFIIIAWLYQKRKFIHRLELYINKLNESYLHPDSPYIKYCMENIYNKNNNKNIIYYITNNNNLKLIKYNSN